MSELINNLQQIYNAKLAIKSAIGTQSDELADYASYINALKPNGYTYLTENGSYNISAYEYAYVNVSSSIPEGYVLPAGTITCDSNGVNYDVKQYAYAYINVEGGGQTIDPWHDYTSIYNMIMNELTEADYVGSTIMSDFTYGLNTAEWTETVTINTEDKKIRIYLTEAEDQGVIGQSLEDYPDLYRNIFPIIQNATLTDPSIDDPDFDPQEEGYDYVLEGELYAWNLNDMAGEVEEITENGFYPSGGTCPLGFYVNIEGGGSEPENWIFDQNVGDMETEYTFSFDSSTKAVIEEGTSENPVYLGTINTPDAQTIDIKGYYDNGYWYVGDVDNSSVIDWTNGRQASDSDTIVLYSFENSEDSSVYDDLLISLVSDGNGDLTGEVRIYVLNNYTSEEGEEEFSIGYTEEEPESDYVIFLNSIQASDFQNLDGMNNLLSYNGAYCYALNQETFTKRYPSSGYLYPLPSMLRISKDDNVNAYLLEPTSFTYRGNSYSGAYHNGTGDISVIDQNPEAITSNDQFTGRLTFLYNTYQLRAPKKQSISGVVTNYQNGPFCNDGINVDSSIIIASNSQIVAEHIPFEYEKETNVMRTSDLGLTNFGSYVVFGENGVEFKEMFDNLNHMTYDCLLQRTSYKGGFGDGKYECVFVDTYNYVGELQQPEIYGVKYGSDQFDYDSDTQCYTYVITLPANGNIQTRTTYFEFDVTSSSLTNYERFLFCEDINGTTPQPLDFKIIKLDDEITEVKVGSKSPYVCKVGSRYPSYYMQNRNNDEITFKLSINKNTWRVSSELYKEPEE